MGSLFKAKQPAPPPPFTKGCWLDVEQAEDKEFREVLKLSSDEFKRSVDVLKHLYAGDKSNHLPGRDTKRILGEWEKTNKRLLGE
ncbi:hypothetical protein EBZ38_03880 [bacterium]|nr:hypothetical protein [bacterium]